MSAYTSHMMHARPEMPDKTLDSFDRRILMLVQENGALGPSELSPLVHLSPSQCSRRLQRLKDEGYIQNVVTLLDPERLNLNVSAYVVVKLRSHTQEDERNFRALIAKLPEVVSCDYLTGDADFMLRVFTRDLKSYHEFLTAKLLPEAEIETARSSIITASVKNTTALPLEYC